ncbi:MAG: hypothetical protein PHI40_05485, partial [Caldisericia bacterium]|nr:hypothetical protein [Caldisericia bacterium]
MNIHRYVRNTLSGLLSFLFVVSSFILPWNHPIPSTYASEGSDWPTFHQNESRTGVSSENIQVEGLLEQWRFQTGSSISSSPIVQNN